MSLSPAGVELEILVSPSKSGLGDLLLGARGEWIAVLDSRCVCDAGWLQRLRQTADTPADVLGGAVQFGGPDALADWAAYYADYGSFALPARERETPILAGNHVLYRRDIIRQHQETLRAGYAKTRFHSELERLGARFFFDPSLIVTCRVHEEVLAMARRYFAEARTFAAERSHRFSPLRRFAYFAGTPALPAVLLFRRLAAVWPKRGHRLRLLACLPLLSFFVLAWSSGEAVGSGEALWRK